MDSVNMIKAFRYQVAKDSTMQSLFGESTDTDVLNKRLFYKDSTYVGVPDGYDYPALSFKLDDDEPMIRGCDDNTLMLEATIYNKFGNDQAQIINLRIKDRLKLILEDQNVAINAQALTFPTPVVLKVRDVAWVSAISFDEKTQGSERLHKNICTLKLTVGD